MEITSTLSGVKFGFCWGPIHPCSVFKLSRSFFGVLLLNETDVTSPQNLFPSAAELCSDSAPKFRRSIHDEPSHPGEGAQAQAGAVRYERFAHICKLKQSCANQRIFTSIGANRTSHTSAGLGEGSGGIPFSNLQTAGKVYV